jgi:hypothetical protein
MEDSKVIDGVILHPTMELKWFKVEEKDHDYICSTHRNSKALFSHVLKQKFNDAYGNPCWVRIEME